MPETTAHWILTVRAPRGRPLDLMRLACTCVAHDFWPVPEYEGRRVRAGDHVVLHAAGFGLIGDALVRSAWTEWSGRVNDVVARCLPASPGGVTLDGAVLWAHALAVDDLREVLQLFTRRMEPRITHDVEAIDTLDWLQILAAQDRVGEPWRPHAPGLDTAVPGLGWLAVEEVFDATAEIELARWPRLRDGRPVFVSAVYRFSVDMRSLRHVWDARREPATRSQRTEPRSGAVLAVPIHWTRLDTNEHVELAQIVDGTPIEITPAARELAQTAFYEAVTSPVAEAEAAELGLEDPEEWELES